MEIKQNCVTIYLHPNGKKQVAAFVVDDVTVLMGYGQDRKAALADLEEKLKDYAVDPLGQPFKIHKEAH